MSGGLGKIEWAAQWMPVLGEIGQRLRDEGSIEGVKVGVSLVLEPKTVNLALALHRAGAQVALHARATEVIDDVARAAREQGLAVFASSSAADSQLNDSQLNDSHPHDSHPHDSHPDDTRLADEFLAWGPEILVDDGAAMIRRLHRRHPAVLAKLKGAAEETTSGVRPLRAMHAQGQLRVPVIAVNDAPVKYLFDNVYGTAQSCLMTFLDLTNLQLASRNCLVIGYGYVGRGLARYLSGFGARVTVSELDPVKALRALHDGNRVAAFAHAAPAADVIFSATGLRGTVAAEQLSILRNGVFLAVAGGAEEELPMRYLRGLGTGRTVRPRVQAFTLPSGTTIKVIAEGECMNVSAAEGNPIEIMDLSLSLQALAVREIARNPKPAPAVYPLPDDLVREVATLRLNAAGATLEPLTDEIAHAMTQW